MNRRELFCAIAEELKDNVLILVYNAYVHCTESRFTD